MNALLALSRAIDAHHRARRPRRLLAGAGRRADQRRQRRWSASVQLQLERVPRDPVVPVLGDLPVLRRLHAAAQRARAHRHHPGRLVARARRTGSTSSARASSCCRCRSSSCGCPGRCSSTRYARHEVSTNAGGLIIWPARLMVPIGFCAADHAGRLRADQAHRVPARAHSGSTAEAREQVRRGGAGRGDRAAARHGRDRRYDGRRTHDRVAHREHGAADVRGAHRHAADRLPGRLLARGRRHRVRPDRHQARPARHIAAAGAARARLRRDVERHAARRAVLHVHGTDPRTLAAWPRTCSTRSASCSDRCAAGSPTPSSSSARCWRRRPASSPRASSRWD